jgi:hypothetical protein
MIASTSQLEFAASLPAPASPAQPEFVAGGVRLALRLEGFATFGAALACYAHAGLSWPAFVLLFLTPDISLLAYVAGPRAGALGYNFAHNYAPALALALVGFIGGMPAAAAAGLIWIAHIGFDRLLGYGLKYPSGFADTHLGRVGGVGRR